MINGRCARLPEDHSLCPLAGPQWHEDRSKVHSRETAEIRGSTSRRMLICISS